MKFNRLQLKNYRSYQHLDIDLSNRQVVGILGETGSGKSTIIEAVRYVLYGKLRDKSEDDVIKDGTEEMQGTLIFQHRGVVAKIERSKKKGATSKVKFWVNDEAQNVHGGVRAANKIVEEWLGVDDDIFCAVAFFRQGMGDEFMSSTPANRRKYLTTLIANEGLADVAEIARERQRQANTQATKTSGEIAAYQAQLAGVDLEQIKIEVVANRAAIDDLEEQLVEAQQQVERDQQLINAAVKRKGLVAEIADLEERERLSLETVSSQQEQIDGCERLKVDYQNFLARWQEESDKLSCGFETKPDDIQPIVEEKAAIEARIQQLNNSHNGYSSLESECPYCNQSIDSATRAELLDDIADQLAQAHMDLAGVEENLGTLKDLNIKYRAWRDHHLQKPTEPVDHSDYWLQQQAQENQSLTNVRKMLVERKEELQSVTIPDDFDPNIAKSVVLSIKNKIQSANTQLTQAQARIDTYRQVNQLYVRAQQKYAEQITQLDIAKELVKSFAVKIPAMVIENVLGTLMGFTNQLLGEFGTGFQVKFETQGYTQAGEARETLNVVIVKPDGTSREYESFSGGQKAIINFSVRLAMAHMMAARNGVQLRSIFLDEVFSELDQKSLQVMLNVIGVLRTMFDQIFMVTHIEALKDHFPDIIQVTMEEEKSYAA